jgi:hypothetical protein
VGLPVRVKIAGPAALSVGPRVYAGRGLCGVAIQLGPDSAAVCATTLAVMTMITVADFSTDG